MQRTEPNVCATTCTSYGAIFRRQGRPHGTTQHAGFAVGDGQSHGTTREAGNNISDDMAHITVGDALISMNQY